MPLLLLAGCTTNALRVQTSTEFATSSTATVTRTNTYLNAVAARQRAAAAALVASDASCFPGRTIRIRSPNNGRQPFCMRPRERQNDANSFEFTLQPLGPSQLKPRLELLAAIADYGAALEKIVGTKKPDVGAELTGFAGKIDDVATIAAFVSGTDVPKASPVLKTDQAQSLVAIIQFATELRKERLQVDAVRRLATARGDVIDRTLASLGLQIDEIADIDRDDAQIEERMLVQQYVSSAPSWQIDRRREAVGAILDARAAVDDRAAAARGVKAAVVELEAAHATLRDLLDPDPRLSAAQKKELRGIARERLWRALDLIAGAAAAFAGA
jgi:hypothetical protein